MLRRFAHQCQGVDVTLTNTDPGVAPWRARLRALVEANWFQSFIIVVIAINAIGLGLETFPSVNTQIGPFLGLIDTVALIIFVLEISLKLLAYRLGYFRDPWNVFDFVIVAIAVLPMSGGLSVMRALRILRAVRIISVVPRMRRVVEGLLNAIPSLGAVIALLAIVFYICAVMATKLFGSEFDALFGSLPKSLFTLFQLMTLEDWPGGIVRPIMEVYPYAWLFFIPFILTVTFAVLNLFIAIIVNSMEEAAKDDTEMLHKDAETLHAEAQQQTHQHETLVQEIRSLREEIAALRGLVKPGD
ncbi:MAG: ion transporter [Pseudolabrys sp.]|nr:ion transporter [Pseudolabrys sp.]